MAGLLWLVWADLGLPFDSLPPLGVEKIRTRVVDRPHGHVLRSAGDSADSPGAINDRLKPHLVRRTFDCCHADAIEG
jgi:hypothetical protein